MTTVYTNSYLYDYLNLWFEEVRVRMLLIAGCVLMMSMPTRVYCQENNVFDDDTTKNLLSEVHFDQRTFQSHEDAKSYQLQIDQNANLVKNRLEIYGNALLETLKAQGVNEKALKYGASAFYIIGRGDITKSFNKNIKYGVRDVYSEGRQAFVKVEFKF